MNTTIRILFFGFLLLITVSVAQGKNHENKTYVCQQDSLPLTLAILPVMHKYTDTFDTLSYKFWQDSGLVEPISSSVFLKLLTEDSTMLAQFIKLGEYEYNKEQRKTGPSLYMVFDSVTVQSLREWFKGADLFLFPVKFGMKSLGIATGGSVTMQLYDLRTGELVYERERSLNVDVTGEVGEQFLMIGLLGFANEDYDKYFLKKLKKEK